MAWHLYVDPVVTYNPTPRMTSRGAKYIAGVLPVSWAMIDYGFQPLCLAAADLTATQDSSVGGHPEVIPVPDDLNGLVGSQILNTLINKLEANFTPGTWVQSTTAYREIVRLIGGISRLLERYAVNTNDTTAIFASFTLDSLFSALPQAIQTGLTNAGASLNIDTSLFVSASTLRDVLKSAGDQLAGPRTIGGISI